MNIKVTLRNRITTNAVIKTGIDPKFDSVQFIAFSDEMKARVLEMAAKGGQEFKLEPTDESWKGEKMVNWWKVVLG
jgi:hypothetical protein